MADDPTNPNPDPSQPPNQQTNPPAAEAPPSSSPPDNTKMAEALGKLKAENETLKAYQEQVDPFLQTVWSLDQPARDQLIAAHNKRLGITTSDEKPVEPPKPAEASKIEIDTRNAIIVDKVNQFYQRHGIDKLEGEAKGDVDLKISTVLKEMLDPMGNKKDLAQVIEDVPLAKLDKILDDVYFIITKDKQLEEAKNQGKQEASTESLGIIGSMPSQSVNPDTLTLTAQEKQVAAKMGVSEDKFLARKKEISQRGGAIY